jgi:hypothetical protein
MNASIRLVTLVALVVIGSGCNHRDSPSDAAWQPSALPGARPGVSSVTFQPTQALAGSPVWGAVALTFPAPAGGVDVSLSGDSGVESLPSRVTVPAGSQRGIFQVATRESSGDRNVTVKAFADSGTVATGTLPVWATVPDSFSFQSTYAVRLIPPEAQVWATCERGGGLVRIRFTRPQTRWSETRLEAVFAAPSGMPLSVGTYEGAIGDWNRSPSTPSLAVLGGCSGPTPTGRFVVRAVDCASDGTVGQFWVTYEQHCYGETQVGGPGSYGDIRVTNATKLPGY